MRNPRAEFTDRSGNTVITHPNLKFAVNHYGRRDMGGPYQATITVTGSESELFGLFQWLTYGVKIVDHAGTPVWWGYVNELQLDVKALILTYSITDMFNRTRVAYREQLPDGTFVRSVTADLDNAESQDYYGAIKERTIRAADLSDAAAVSLNTDTLAAFAKFAPSLEVGSGTGAEARMTIRCNGWWQSLAWRLSVYTARDIAYTEENTYGPYGYDVRLWPAGYTNGAKGDGANALYFGVSGFGIVMQSFTLSTANGRSPARVTALQPMMWRNPALPETGSVRVTVYGWNGGNPSGAPVIGSSSWRAASSFPTDADWITFDIPTDIWLLPGVRYWFGVYRDGAIADPDYVAWMGLRTTYGSELCKGYDASGWRVGWNTPPTIIGMNLRVAVEHGESTLSVGATTDKLNVAQSFLVDGADSLYVTAFKFRCFRFGTLGASISAMLYSDSAGIPNTLLGTATVADPDTLIGTEMDWHTYTLNAPVQVNPATTYWIVLDGGVGSNETKWMAYAASLAKGYAYGATKVWNGSIWSTPSPDVELLFEVHLSELTTTQAKRLITTYGAKLPGGTTVITPSTIYTSPTRDGSTDVLQDVEDVLRASSALATVLSDRSVIIDAEPSETATAYLQRDGRLVDATGAPVNMQSCPVGLWIAPRDIAPAGASFAPVGASTLYYVEEADYDVDRGTWRPRLRGQRAPFDFGGVKL